MCSGSSGSRPGEALNGALERTQVGPSLERSLALLPQDEADDARVRDTRRHTTGGFTSPKCCSIPTNAFSRSAR